MCRHILKKSLNNINLTNDLPYKTFPRKAGLYFLFLLKLLTIFAFYLPPTTPLPPVLHFPALQPSGGKTKTTLSLPAAPFRGNRPEGVNCARTMGVLGSVLLLQDRAQVFKYANTKPGHPATSHNFSRDSASSRMVFFPREKSPPRHRTFDALLLAKDCPSSNIGPRWQSGKERRRHFLLNQASLTLMMMLSSPMGTALSPAFDAAPTVQSWLGCWRKKNNVTIITTSGTSAGTWCCSGFGTDPDRSNWYTGRGAGLVLRG